jgi:hypothetical protein
MRLPQNRNTFRTTFILDRFDLSLVCLSWIHCCTQLPPLSLLRAHGPQVYHCRHPTHSAQSPSRVTTFPPFPLPCAYLPMPRSYSLFRQPRHLPFHCHTSLHHHLPTWLFFILISDSDSLCLPSYLQRLVQYFDPLWQALPRPHLYLTLASAMTKP